MIKVGTTAKILAVPNAKTLTIVQRLNPFRSNYESKWVLHPVLVETVTNAKPGQESITLAFNDVCKIAANVNTVAVTTSPANF